MRSSSGKTGTYLSRGPWSQLIAVDAYCPDGKVRKVRVGTPDTMWSAPGRVRVAGINVSGHVWLAGDFASSKYPNEWVFTPFKTAKNYAKLAAKLNLDPSV